MHSGEADARHGIAGCGSRQAGENDDQRPSGPLPIRSRQSPVPGAETERLVGLGLQCAAASGVRDGGGPPATGLQEQVANRRKRRGSKARVVSVTEKAPRGVRCETGRRTPVNCRPSVESTQMTSKPVSEVAPGSVWTTPAYGPDGVRHRGSAQMRGRQG
jgi:hypothetical protein